MIVYDKKDNDINNKISFLSKIKSFKQLHPYLFYGIIIGIIIIIIAIIILCVALIKKRDKENEEDTPFSNNDIQDKIFPLPENSKSEVMDIYNNIGDNDNGTLSQFCEYLSQNALNLKEDQKVYLAYYWITQNIEYDLFGAISNIYESDPEVFFPNKRTVCYGFTKLFTKLLSCMNYQESKVKTIVGYAKMKGYLPYKENIFSNTNHEWNAVEINGKWCLIDTTWYSWSSSEFYLCPSPHCFIREHFPINDEYQFLENPISLEKFANLIDNVEEICQFNLEIIEDKAIQNICGKTKVFINFLDDLDHNDFHLVVGSFVDYRFPIENLHVPQFLANRTENGFEIDISVNEKGYSSISLSNFQKSFGAIYFKCDEEPDNKTYYPTMMYAYYTCNLQLIAPVQRDLIKGKKYDFEVKTNDFDELFVQIGQERISMTKNGNIFKENNIYIHNDNIYISTINTTLIIYKGIGDNIDYPTGNGYSTLKARLIRPLISTLSKGQEYTFELRCETEERIIISGGDIFEVMEREGNIYKKTITIGASTTATKLRIDYVRDIMVTNLYEYKINN